MWLKCNNCSQKINEVDICISETTGRKIMKFKEDEKIKGTILKNHSEDPDKWSAICSECQKLLTKK